MQVAEKEVRSFYKSGFPKQMQRGKYDLKINERLKAARNKKGLSARGVVKALAERGVSIGHSTLQGYEAGEDSINHRYPSLPNLIELANFYDCSLDYLFGGTDKVKPHARKTDLLEVLNGYNPVLFNGKQLSEKQIERITSELEILITESV